MYVVFKSKSNTTQGEKVQNLYIPVYNPIFSY